MRLVQAKDRRSDTESSARCSILGTRYLAPDTLTDSESGVASGHSLFAPRRSPMEGQDLGRMPGSCFGKHARDCSKVGGWGVESKPRTPVRGYSRGLKVNPALASGACPSTNHRTEQSIGRRATRDDREVHLSGGYGFFDIGYVFAARPQWRAYGLIGFGGGGWSLDVLQSGRIPDFLGLLKRSAGSVRLQTSGSGMARLGPSLWSVLGRPGRLCLTTRGGSLAPGWGFRRRGPNARLTGFCSAGRESRGLIREPVHEAVI